MSRSKIFIFCLGNPGKEYDKTPHNLGFIFADRLTLFLSECINHKTAKQDYFKFNGNLHDIIISKPKTYLNLSGIAVKEMMSMHNFSSVTDFLQYVIIVYDDADIPMFKIKMKNGHGVCGHNGLRSVNNALQLKNHSVQKIALGCDSLKRRSSILSDYVLSKMSLEEYERWLEIIDNWLPSFISKIDSDGL